MHINGKIDIRCNSSCGGYTEIEARIEEEGTGNGEIIIFYSNNIAEDFQRAYAWLEAKKCFAIKLMPSCEQFLSEKKGYKWGTRKDGKETIVKEIGQALYS